MLLARAGVRAASSSPTGTWSHSIGRSRASSTRSDAAIASGAASSPGITHTLCRRSEVMCRRYAAQLSHCSASPCARPSPAVLRGGELRGRAWSPSPRLQQQSRDCLSIASTCSARREAAVRLPRRLSSGPASSGLSDQLLRPVGRTCSVRDGCPSEVQNEGGRHPALPEVPPIVEQAPQRNPADASEVNRRVHEASQDIVVGRELRTTAATAPAASGLICPRPAQSSSASPMARRAAESQSPLHHRDGRPRPLDTRPS